MNKITLGKTNLVIEKNGFGCLPIQRIREQDAVDLLHKAYDGGINFFDTARAYSDSEQKVGAAFSSMRDKIVLATKTGAQTAEGFWKDLETSLRTLKTDYIDIYQFHNPAFCPKPGGEDGLYDAALEAKKQGKIRHISITNHRLAVAHEAIDSGLYETLQFPFSYLAGEQEMELVRKCRETNMGFIAMKGMAGGLIRDGFTAAAWMAQQDGVDLHPAALAPFGGVLDGAGEVAQALGLPVGHPHLDGLPREGQPRQALGVAPVGLARAVVGAGGDVARGYGHDPASLGRELPGRDEAGAAGPVDPVGRLREPATHSAISP